MMICIKGMEMPKNDCTAYREVIISNNYIGDGKTKILVHDAQTNNFIGEAIEIPEPHGRLIDADMAYQETMKYGEHFRKSVLNVINNLPTVIESEVEEWEYT